MGKQIAAIPIALVINGQRKVIPPGGEIPDDLPEHDRRQLLAARALRDDAADARAYNAAQKARAEADAAFQGARQQVKEAAASTQSADTAKTVPAPAKRK